MHSNGLSCIHTGMCILHFRHHCSEVPVVLVFLPKNKDTYARTSQYALIAWKSWAYIAYGSNVFYNALENLKLETPHSSNCGLAETIVLRD